MTTVLLESYLGTPLFEDFMEKFFEAITSNDMVKHFFLVAKKPAVDSDLRCYWPYLLPKTNMEYRKPPIGTSTLDIQLPERQFAEIVIIMTKLMREMKFNNEHAPQLMHEILELIEETRSKTADTAQSTLEGNDIEPDIIQLVLKRNKVITEVMPSKAIKTIKGLESEVWIRLNRENKELRLSGKLLLNTEGFFEDQLTELLEKQAEKVSTVSLKLVRDLGPPHFAADHILPYDNGIPIRLFMRCLQRFSYDLSTVYGLDKDKILKKKVS